MDWKMIGFLIWLQVLFSVNGLKLEISIKPVDENAGIDNPPPAVADTADEQSNGGAFRQLDDKIIGGVAVKPHTIPWQAGLFVGLNICGGTILCPKFVMTAGHCVVDSNPRSGHVLVGTHNWRKAEKSKTKHNIKAFHLHPQFKPYNIKMANDDNDFAIVELIEPIIFRKEAKALYLPSPTDTEFGADTKFMVTGWGRTESYYSHKLADVLQSITVPWISDADCKGAYKDKKLDKDGGLHQFVITDSQICAGYLGVGKVDACSGDSGGPLAWVDPKTNQVKLIGSVSFGHECATADSPGVYAETTFALDWIKTITGNCNEETCNAGNCVTFDSLDRSAKRLFKRLTPYKKNG